MPPAPTVDFIAVAPTATRSFSLEAGMNAFNSLSLLNKAEFLSGLDEWVTRTLANLPKERLHRHLLVFYGLYYAVEPKHAYPTFEAYIADLERQPPEVLRDRVFEAYAQFPLLKSISADPAYVPAPIDIPSLLADPAVYLKYLRERFTPDHVFEELERESHRWLNDPAAMQTLMVDHIRSMWTDYIEPEWNRVKPLLQACVDAYRPIDLSGLSHLEAVQRVVGHEVDEHWQKMLARAERLVFVPSAHVGPYLTKFEADQTLYIFFGAREPQGVPGTSPDLSRSELVVRLLALSDDTRLRILHLLAQRGEMCSPDIIRELDLSQSAASRHLQQLSATGYLTERRREGAKCYSLNLDHIDDTFGALTKFLQRIRA